MLMKGNTIDSLETAVADLHTCTSESLSRIHGMAKCALIAMESPSGVQCIESIAQVLMAIVNDAGMAIDTIDGIAGDAGIDTLDDPAWQRRMQAAHSAAKGAV